MREMEENQVQDEGTDGRKEERIFCGHIEGYMWRS